MGRIHITSGVDVAVAPADVAGEPDGVMGLLGPVMARMVKRSVDGDYRRLRALLEV